MLPGERPRGSKYKPEGVRWKLSRKEEEALIGSEFPNI